MGFKISWIGFKGLSKGDVLSNIGFHDSGRHDDANEASFSLAELPTGWSILFSNDIEFGSPENLRSLSNGADILSCQVHEGVMYSAVHQAAEGRDLWSVCHDCQIDMYNLSVSRNPPSIFADISKALHAKQDENGGVDAGVDYIFDIPVEVAFQLTGYRHDRWRFDWGEPSFTVIERTC